MCYSNSNNCFCGRRTGSCFSCSSCRNANNSCDLCDSSLSTVPYYVNPFGWYADTGSVVVLAVVGVNSCSSCGRNSCCGL